MPSPIAAMCNVHGESAIIYTPTDATSDQYDPTAADDFAPGQPVQIPVTGFIANIDDDITGLTGVATGGFTIEAFAPIPMTANLSKLAWNGITYTILKYRERHFQGALDGYTLTLGA